MGRAGGPQTVEGVSPKWEGKGEGEGRPWLTGGDTEPCPHLGHTGPSRGAEQDVARDSDQGQWPMASRARQLPGRSSRSRAPSAPQCCRSRAVTSHEGHFPSQGASLSCQKRWPELQEGPREGSASSPPMSRSHHQQKGECCWQVINYTEFRCLLTGRTFAFVPFFRWRPV